MKNRAQPIPEDFIRRIKNQFPEEYPAFLNALEDVPATSIRINPSKWTPLCPFPSPPAMPVPWSLNGWFLTDRPSFTMDPLFHAGCYYVQEPGSMFLEQVLKKLLPAGHNEIRKYGTSFGETSQPDGAPVPGIILDACAAPGGKTTLLASLYPDSLVVANEPVRSRIPSLLENSIKWGTGNIVITQNDTSRIAEFTGFFDLILADAPCSGEGLFRKDHDARKEWSSDKAHHCSLRQRSILGNLWQALRPGGFLVYSTCTFNPEENEMNIAWLLHQTGGESVTVDASGPMVHISKGPVSGYAFYPHKTTGEGFFLSIIRKPADAVQDGYRSPDGYPSPDPGRGPSGSCQPAPQAVSRPAHRSGNRPAVRPNSRPGNQSSFRPVSGHSKIGIPDPEIIQQAEPWFSGDDFSWFTIGDRLFRIRTPHLEILRQLSSALTIRYAGTEAGKIIRDDARPSPAAALDIRLNSELFPHLNCSREEALKFLRREPPALPDRFPPGWILVTYSGLPLGWARNIGSRLNNYHPKEWRIRNQSVPSDPYL